MTTYAVQFPRSSKIEFTTNSKIAAQRIAKSVPSAVVHGFDDWNRPLGVVQYSSGRRVESRPPSPMACLYQRRLESAHGLTYLPARDPSSSVVQDAWLERSYFDEYGIHVTKSDQ